MPESAFFDVLNTIAELALKDVAFALADELVPIPDEKSNGVRVVGDSFWAYHALLVCVE